MPTLTRARSGSVQGDHHAPGWRRDLVTAVIGGWLVAAVFAALAVLAYSGSQFFTGAARALPPRQANMHTLIATGTAVAWVCSTIAVALQGG